MDVATVVHPGNHVQLHLDFTQAPQAQRQSDAVVAYPGGFHQPMTGWDECSRRVRARTGPGAPLVAP